MGRSERPGIGNQGYMLAAVLAITIANVFYSPQARGTDNHVMELYKSGVEFHHQKNYERAIQDFDQVIKLDSNFKYAYNDRGAAFSDLGQNERAIQDYNQAIKLDPNFRMVYNNRGNAYKALGRHERAIQDYDQALRLDPKFSFAYYNRGSAYLALGKYERAIQDYDQAIRLDPNHTFAYNGRGNAYKALGQPERAIQDYDQATRLDPNFSFAYYDRGLVYNALGQYERAIRDFDQNIKLDPNYKKPYPNRGNAYLSLGQYERAIQDYDQAIGLDPNYTFAYHGRGLARIELGQLELAVSDLRSALAKRSGCFRLNELPALALCYALNGKKEESNKCLSETMDLWEHATEAQRLESSWLLLWATRAQVQMGQIAKARETLAKMSGSGKLLGAGQKAQMKALSGLIEMSEGNRLVAEADMSEALKICSSDALVRAWSKSLNDKTSIVQSAGGCVADAAVNKPLGSASTQSTNRPIRDKWAVIVGVGKYADPSIPTLKYPAKDARDFSDFLISKANFKPDHVRLLLDEKATRERIWTEIGDNFLPRVVGPDDLVVLYFATHGSPAERDVRKNSYLIAYDTKKTRLHADGIEMQSLLEELNKRTGADRILIVLDACHSGAADPSARDIDFHSAMDIDQFSVGRGNIILSSSQPDERSWESKRYRNGVFTKNLIDSLSKNPKIIASFDELKNSVLDEVHQEFGERQTPRIKADGWEGKDLMLAAPVLKSTVISPTVKSLLEPDSKVVNVVPAPKK